MRRDAVNFSECKEIQLPKINGKLMKNLHVEYTIIMCEGVNQKRHSDGMKIKWKGDERC